MLLRNTKRSRLTDQLSLLSQSKTSKKYEIQVTPIRTNRSFMTQTIKRKINYTVI